MKSEEKGRSMIELIAVLAIMGVLSVGSLLAYDYTRERARAAGVIDVSAKLLAVARVKGQVVDSETARMTTMRDHGVKVWAQIEGSEGKVVICGCDPEGTWDSFRQRVGQMSGVGDEDDPSAHTVECDGNGADANVSRCFSLTFPDPE